MTGHPWRALAAGALPLLLLAAHASRLRTGLPRGDWLPASMESARALYDLRAMGRGGVVQSVGLVIELPEGTSVRRDAEWQALGRFVATLEADSRTLRVRSIVGVAALAGLTRKALVTLPGPMTRRLTAGLVSDDGRLALIEVLPRESVAPEALVDWERQFRAAGSAPLGMPSARITVGGLPAFNADCQDAWPVPGDRRAGGRRYVRRPAHRLPVRAGAAEGGGAQPVVGRGGVRRPDAGLPGRARGRPAGDGRAVRRGVLVAAGHRVLHCVRAEHGLRAVPDEPGDGGPARRLGRPGGHRGGPGDDGAGDHQRGGHHAGGVRRFTLGDVLVTKMLGFTLAVAVLIDATVVRMVIGPALLQLAGRWNWWPGSVSPPAER